MSDDIVGSRFFGHRTGGWHNKGTSSDEDVTAVELYKDWGGYEFSKRPVTITLNGVPTEIGDYALVRSPIKEDLQERNFGFVKKNYVILQPYDVAKDFDESVGLPVETMGCLGAGERMFITWELGNNHVGKVDDIVKYYGFIAAGFDGIIGNSLNVTTERVVCKNTWVAAIREAQRNKERGKGVIWSGRHNSVNLEQEFKIWMKYVKDESIRQQELVEDFFSGLVKTPIEKKEDVYKLLFKAYPDPDPIPDFFPPELKKNKQEKIDKEAEKQERIRKGIWYVFDNVGTEITPDLWGVFNATTEYMNYGMPSKKDVDYSVLFGNRSKMMNDMAEVLRQEISK